MSRLSKFSSRELVKEIAVKHGFKLKHTNEKGEPDLYPYVYSFVEELEASTYPLIPLGIGKVTIALSRSPSAPALFISNLNTNKPTGTEVFTKDFFPDDILPSEEILVGLEIKNVRGIDNLINELLTLKKRIQSGEFD